MSSALRDRWKTPEGRALANEATEFLLGKRGKLPTELGTHNGRIDLRGLEAPSPAAGSKVAVGSATGRVLTNVPEARNVVWDHLDLSQSRLPGVQFFDTRISDCLFDDANCRGWRLWDSQIDSSSFSAADLSDSALGTGAKAGAVAWRDVSFDKADMRRIAAQGALFESCTFRDSNLSDAEFLQITMRDCLFAGVLRNILFDGREISNRPVPGVLTDVDFSEAIFEDVEFRGCRFVGLKLPRESGVYVIPKYPAVALRAIQLMDGDSSMDARMLRGQLRTLSSFRAHRILSIFSIAVTTLHRAVTP